MNPWPISMLVCTATLGVALAAACARQPGTEPGPAAPEPAATLPPGQRSASARLEQQLVANLGGDEHIVGRDELLRLGDSAALTTALSSIYRDSSVNMFIRVRALTSLHFFPSPESRAALEAALLAADTTDIARRTAVKAYGVAFGEASVPVLARLLDHVDVHTRNAAAQMLGHIRGGEALPNLRRRLLSEPSPFVRKTIEAGLAP